MKFIKDFLYTFTHRNKFGVKIYKEYIYQLNRLIYMISPRLSANKAFKHFYKRNIDWNNPTNVNEKIFWLQFNTDTSLWTRCADKYAVRLYLKELGMEKYLVKLYGKWDHANEIDFNSLPNSFVLKTNNASETVLVVKDKSKLDYDKTRKKLNKWLKRPYGYYAAQTHYLRMKPCIIAEELLIQSESDSSISPNSLIDYKMWCINGKFEFVWIAYDRTASDVKMAIYDKEWNSIPNALASNSHYKYVGDEVQKPSCWQELISLAEKLATPFPELRADFYVINGKPVFGEMTFTAGYGFFTESFDNQIGSKIILPKSDENTTF